MSAYPHITLSGTVKKHKLLFLIISAFLTAAVFVLLSSLLPSGEETGELLTINAVDAVYDLSGYTESAKQSFLLPAGDTYYPDTYLSPSEEAAAVAESVTNYDTIRAQYLSQRFEIELPDHADIYKITCRVSGRHALRIYINGTLVRQSGILGETKQTTQVWENNLTCYGVAKDGKMDVIVQTAQFYHQKRGASLAELVLENANTSSGITDREKGLLVMGALFCASCFLFFIHLLHPVTGATLYFALACIVMAIRECLQSQAWTYFSWIPGNFSFLLEYFSVVLLTILLSLYLGQYGKGRFLRMIQMTAITGSILYGACVLFADSLFYTSVLLYYQILLIICILLGIGGIFRNLRSPSSEDWAALYGIAVFYIAAVRDILMYNDVFGDGPNEPISEAAMLVFVLAQALSLFLRNNRLVAEARSAEQRQFLEKEGLARLNQMKTEFLGNISHELKTPLMVVSGYAQNVKRTAEGRLDVNCEDIVQKMTLIVSETERLSLLVRQLLDLTRMDEGYMHMDKTPCYIDEIIYDAVNTHYPILNKNENQLDIRIAGPMPITHADSAKIAQVIINLIANASAHTKRGRITVTAAADEKNLKVLIADSGEGMSPEQLSGIFERYSHRHSEKEQALGTGLGLPICKYIIEEHGGTIGAESQLGKGTVVSFTLPIL